MDDLELFAAATAATGRAAALAGLLAEVPEPPSRGVRPRHDPAAADPTGIRRFAEQVIEQRIGSGEPPATLWERVAAVRIAAGRLDAAAADERQWQTDGPLAGWLRVKARLARATDPGLHAPRAGRDELRALARRRDELAAPARTEWAAIDAAIHQLEHELSGAVPAVEQMIGAPSWH